MKLYLILLLFVFSWALSAQGAERLLAELQAQQQVVNALNKEIMASMDANADLAYVEGLAKKLEREEEALLRKRRAYLDALSDNPYLLLNANVLEQLDKDGEGALSSLNKNTVGKDFYKKYTGYLLKDVFSYYLYPAAINVTTTVKGETERAKKAWRGRGKYTSTATLANDSLLYRGLIHIDGSYVNSENEEDMEKVEHRAAKLGALSRTYESTYTVHLGALRLLGEQLQEKKGKLKLVGMMGEAADKIKLLETKITMLEQQIENTRAAALFAVNLEAREHFKEAWKEHRSTVDGYLKVYPYKGDFYFKFQKWAIRKTPETDKE